MYKMGFKILKSLRIGLSGLESRTCKQRGANGTGLPAHGWLLAGSVERQPSPLLFALYPLLFALTPVSGLLIYFPGSKIYFSHQYVYLSVCDTIRATNKYIQYNILV